MPIKITGRFATARDTAQVLGVSRHRTNQLIKLVERSLVRRHKEGSSGSVTAFSSKRKARNGSAKPASVKRTSRRNGSASVSKNRAQAATAKR